MSTILRLDRVAKSYGATPVLTDITTLVNTGEHIGIVGANGVGKSTLLKIIMGEIKPDSGTVVFAPQVQVGYLAQTLKLLDNAHNTLADLIDDALTDVRQLEAQMRALEAQMAEVTGDTLAVLLAAYGDVASRYEALGGYEIDARIAEVFAGLGVDHLARSRPLATLSGGEGTRAALALLLLRAPDVLLLDEPTNHLDVHALAWLEGYLADYRGTALIVSHDREFLNKTVNGILEIDEHTRACVRYAGNYDAYHTAKQQARRRWEDDYFRQQEEIKALRHEIKEGGQRNSNYRAHSDGDKLIRNAKIATHEATVSRRVRDAEARLARLLSDPIPKPPQPLRFEAGSFSIAIEADTLTPSPRERGKRAQRAGGEAVSRAPLVLRADGLCKAYDGRVILRDFNLDVPHGARIAIVGANGTGKSTLLRLLAGDEMPDAGRVRVSPSVRLGYMAQQDEFVGAGHVLPTQPTLYEAFADGLIGSEKDLMNQLLWTGLFRYDDVQTQVGDLSAGQRRKLTLARLMVTQPDVLLLDEPTNHLSFDVLEELEAALRAFPGTVIAASHDRRFLAGFGGEGVVMGE
ncbi:MAG: ABC-F family ATP-binding cassette domain-containing protein [Chloroflexota bacterium]|nr:ABC-F family ATP-binding cassette domain-containing protein [Chloroflexota bacterium]